MHNAWIICLAALCTVTAVTEEKDWRKQCNNCKCFWSNGKRTADCTGIKLASIPSGFSSEIRQIDFSDNPLHSLGFKVMSEAKLHHVNQLRFQNCSLDIVRKTAFEKLHLLIELDLSRNFITWLDIETFKDNLKLRVLSISHNNLMILDDGVFHDLAQLQTLRLHHNQICYVAERAFTHLPQLQHIDLGFNSLPTIYHDFTVYLDKLNVLHLEGNPWVCDCNLEDFRNKVIKDNLIGVISTECAEPKGKLWSSNETFSCLPLMEPQIHLNITLDNDMQITTIGSNVTLTCRVSGKPQPNVEWLRNDRIIEEKQKYFTSKSNDDEYTWINLTITNVDYRDRGIYKCLAKNSKDAIEKKLTLVVPQKIDGVYVFYIYAAVYTLVYAAVYAAIHAEVFTITIFVISGVFVLVTIIALIRCCCVDARNNGSIQSEMDKSSHDTVSLVSDLPEIPISFSFAPEDSIPFPHPLNLMCDQVDLDSTPSRSPVIQMTPRMPFCHVTIPGRSRQSWSSIVSSMTNAMNSQDYYVIGEPIYDNLGLRTSANGSSAWSLDVYQTPRSCRMFQSSSCDPIEEQEDSSTTSDDNSTGSNAEALYSCPAVGELNVKKIPPVPPPKPKKRSGPFLEDEDEDGTEV